MKVTLRQQIEAFTNTNGTPKIIGEYNHCSNFFDWFCKDTSLQNKANSLFKKVIAFLKHHPEINQDSTFVFFKNNCPCNGPLYDDFRICDKTSGNVIYTVTPKCGHSGLAEIWGSSNSFQGPIKTAKNFSQLFK